MKKTMLLMLTLLLTAVGAKAQPDWGYRPNAYEGEHVVYVNLVDANGSAVSLSQGDYLGAFIDGECRGEQIARAADGGTTTLWYFPLRVKGSAADNGKTITFRYYDTSYGQPLEYQLTGSVALTYQNEATTGTLSDLHQLTFVRPQYYSIPDNHITIRVGEQVDMRQLVALDPSNATFPLNAQWDFGNYVDFIRVADNVLTGLAPRKGAYLGLSLGDIKFMGENSSFSVDVIQPATAITIGDDFKDGITVTVGDEATLTKMLSSCYTVTPADYNEHLTWSCSADGITISQDDYGVPQFTPEKAGVYTMTLKGEKATASVRVTVVEDLKGFTYADIHMGVNDTHELTLTPDPSTAMVDPAKVEVRLAGPTLPDGWTWATATATDDSHLRYALTAQSVGTGTLQVYYDGQLMASHALTVGQNYEQKAGWKWVSFFTSGLSDIHASFGDQLEEIRSADALLYNDPKYGYFGDLAELVRGTCYKVKVQEAEPGYVRFVTQATGYDATQNPSVPITEKWNWLGNSYQYDHALDGLFVSDFLADGDRIVSKDDGFAEYQNGQWVGTLTTLLAGQGYMFYNADATKTQLVLHAESEQPQGTPVFHAPRRRPSVWTYNAAPFADNMSIVAQLPESYATSRFSVGAFVNGECRGEGQMVDGHCFITVHADRGDRISFVLHDDVTGGYRTIGESLTFAPMAGTLRAPVNLSVGSATAISTASLAASAIAVVDGRLSFAGLSVRHFTVTAANGAVVLADDVCLDSLAPGIYIVRVVTTDGQTLTKKIAK